MSTEDRVFHTTQTGAERVGAHRTTLLKAAEAGELHGTQRKSPKGRWRFHVDCLDAWALGEKCAHQATGNTARRASR